MEKVTFDRDQIEEVFKRAESSLFSESNMLWIAYETPFTCRNCPEVIDQVHNVPIVYCIWISDGSGPKPVYVGHSSASLSRQRLINHFIKKNPRTGSQLDRVMKAVSEGKLVGISFLSIEPDYMRKPLEEWLIARNSDKLIWNIHGKRKIRQ
jgi:hypothetical protein